MDKLSLIKEYVVCPACFSALMFENVNIQCSSCGVSYKLYDNDIISTVSGWCQLEAWEISTSGFPRRNGTSIIMIMVFKKKPEKYIKNQHFPSS